VEGWQCLLKIRVEIDFDNSMPDSSVKFVLRGSRTAVEDKEERLVLRCANLLLGVGLMFAEELRMEMYISRLVDAVDVAKSGSNAEIGANGYECSVHIVDVLRLGVQRGVVDTSIVNTVLLASGNADFLHPVSLVFTFHTHGEPTISSHCFMGAARSRYFLVIAMFSSFSSSERSIIWDENSGSP